MAVAHALDPQRALGLLTPAAPHVLWIGVDLSAATPADFTALADAIIASNPYYVCCWGPSCERLHDAIDDGIVRRDLDAGREHPLIVTTWHTDEPLAKVVDFVLDCTDIPDDWPPTPPAIRFLLVGDAASEPDLAAAIRSPLFFFEQE